MTDPSRFTALKRGFFCRCPKCGGGKLFARFAKVVKACALCGEDYSAQRADDAPPYIIILVVGHIVVPLVLITERLYHFTMSTHVMIWTPATFFLCLSLLQPVKGLVVALQWFNRMHGFARRA